MLYGQEDLERVATAVVEVCAKVAWESGARCETVGCSSAAHVEARKTRSELLALLADPKELMRLAAEAFKARSTPGASQAPTTAEHAEEDTPLTCEIKDGQLIIRVGIATLAFCATNEDTGVLIDRDGDGELLPSPKVGNAAEFANDVRLVLLHEEEDGSSQLTSFLDEAMREAADEGSLGLEYPGRAEETPK